MLDKPTIKEIRARYAVLGDPALRGQSRQWAPYLYRLMAREGWVWDKAAEVWTKPLKEAAGEICG